MIPQGAHFEPLPVSRDFFDKITSSIDLSQLLDWLGAEIEGVAQVEGYAINLINETGEYLVCEKIALPSIFASMGSTLLKYRYPLTLTDTNIDCFVHGRAVFINRDNLAELPSMTVTRFRNWDLSSMVVLPIIAGEETIGTIILIRQTSGEITPSTAASVQSRAALYANQLRNALRYAQLKAHESHVLQQQHEQEEFRNFVIKINSLADENQIYELITREFLHRFSFDVASILMREGNELVIKNCTDQTGRYGEMLERWRAHAADNGYLLEDSDGASSAAFLRNCHLHFHDVLEVIHLPMSKKDRAVLDILKTPRTFVCMPIRRDETPIGILWLWSLENPVPISEADLATIEHLCSFVSTAILNARLYSTINRQNVEIEGLNLALQARNDQLNQLATRDRLTGAYNYGFFLEELKRRIKEYERQQNGHPFSLVMIDIDHFKIFNDQHGHPAGNEALVEVTTRMRQVAREIDTVCRYGGEEFAVILPMSALEGARQFAERLRCVVAETPFCLASGTYSLTISAGCAEYSSPEETGDLIARADRALYQAKQCGRNLVVTAG